MGFFLSLFDSDTNLLYLLLFFGLLACYTCLPRLFAYGSGSIH